MIQWCLLLFVLLLHDAVAQPACWDAFLDQRLMAWFPGDVGKGMNPKDQYFLHRHVCESVSGGKGGPEDCKTFQNAFHFNGDLDYPVVHYGSTNFDFSAENDNFTIAAWIRPELLRAYHAIVVKGGTQWDYGLWISQFGYLMTGHYGFQHVYYKADKIPTKQWTHVAYTYTADGNVHRMYVNGVLKETTSHTFHNDEVPGIGIGSKGMTFENRFFGLIDEVAIFNTALSSTEMARLAQVEFCGPRTVDLTVSPTTVGEETVITAVLDNGHHYLGFGGPVTIQSGHYTVDGVEETLELDSSSWNQTSGREGVSFTHKFDTAGLHKVCVWGVGQYNRVGEASCVLVPVHDANVPYVAGSGNFYSLTGAFLGDTDFVGQAQFGLVGNADSGDFRLLIQDKLDFSSTAWQDVLFTIDDGVEVKGIGMLNGGRAPNDDLYNFMLQAKASGAGEDEDDSAKLVVKIWWTDQERNVQHVIYDNEGMEQMIQYGTIVVLSE